ncbi:GNAT family N-acetyltransferase [Lysobacter auxotrophicus]|uniref:GNAT family N-acetyltransferase n=1 Tax=Lysobacter auxotrophicus TaxID=2992573 RepID=A0ABM8D943_9GAMM|nr:GNAT family N-acetyltransferase [Lysobacter auxotrophicus]BDU15056.1 GNAT family N-acetyltransferase [Lysobacter auxotrophicus]
MADAATTLRRARIGDAAELARLSAQLGYPQSADAFERRLRRLLISADHPVIVATDDDARLLGFIAIERRLMLETGERVEIVGLVVDESARRRGIGQSLVDAALDWARGIGVGEVMVRSNVARDQSHPFYEGAGFERIKTQHVYLKRV